MHKDSDIQQEIYIRCLQWDKKIYIYFCFVC